MTGYAVAAGIAVVTAGLSWFSGKGFFAILWIVFGLFWLRGFLWVREAPLFEIVPGALIAHLSAVRQHRLEMHEVERLEVTEDKVVVHLNDGSHTAFKSTDLRRGEWQRFVESLTSALAESPTGTDEKESGG